MFWPLLAYRRRDAGLVGLLGRPPRQLRRFASSSCSSRSSRSPIGCCRGQRTLKAVDVIITAGALSAVYGIVQYGIFDFDNLGQRVQGTLGHYMTYSGLIMLVACVAAARVMFRDAGSAVGRARSCRPCSWRSR